MALLHHGTYLQLIDKMIDGGVNILAERSNFLQSINAHFRSILQNSTNARGQLMEDIGRMNGVERLTDGQIPLLIYLQNAVGFFSGLKEEKFIREIIDLIQQRTSGINPIDITALPEINEVIIHRDDTVSLTFMKNGLAAANAVAKLLVPSLENAQPRKQTNGYNKIFNGTGWLIGNTYLITNHHVINAREQGLPGASKEDFQLQAQSTTILFDYDAEGDEGTKVSVEELVAWDEQLDYAILRIQSVARFPLTRAKHPIQLGSDPIAVNIIQHPNGVTKRYGIRNNLISAAEPTLLRYFTDTEGGSSGSPVLNDRWEVVGLHRAAQSVTNVQFQGKTTAYINIGTPITAIMQHLKDNFLHIAQQL